MIITNRQLRAKFLSPEMWHYFRRKLPGIPPREVKARVEECLKFLNMATYCRGNIPVSQEIDDIWHYWILETMEYQRLCQGLTGRRFIHHRSNDYQESRDNRIRSRKNPLEWEVAMLSAYVTNYGPFKPDRVKYWRLADYLVTKRGWSVEQLNKWLQSES
jgi:hypothetical protein